MKIYPLAKPHITQTDKQAVKQVLNSQFLSRGPTVKAFEKKVSQTIRTPYASSVSSGTAGLIIALQALGVSSGDEVITVSFTVPATVNCIIAVGAKPVMIDIEEQTLGMCPQALEQAITDKTKAIIIVHAFGKAAQIKKLMTIAQNNQLKVIEDACEAIGNLINDKPLGSFADVGVFAFYPNKQITSGEGGMLVTHDQELHQQFELLKNHGRTMNGDLYDQISFGWNFRLSDLNAALGLSQLNRLETILKQRRKIATLYQKFLGESSAITLPQFSTHEKSSAWFVFVIAIDNPNLIKEKMHQLGIQTGRYFAPVHLQPYYQSRLPKSKLAITENTANRTLALPFHTQLQSKDIAFICNTLLNCIN